MIAALTGRVDEINAPYVTLDVQGVGYEVRCSQSCLNQMEIGSQTRLVIQTEVKEDSIRLFGFVDQLERRVFNLLLSVKGVGAKSAAEIVSAVDKAELLRIVAGGDVNRLYGIKGVGRKTAERIIVELRDKVAQYMVEQSSTARHTTGSVQPFVEAIEALQALGFSRRDAERAVEQAEQQLGVSRYDQQSPDTGEMDTALVIRTALKFV